jgi:hypothetical protein
MEIVLQYFDGCPNWRTTAEDLRALLSEGLDADIRYELIDTHELAVVRDFHGSPTVLIDGVDLFADDKAQVGLACRIYQTEYGYAGSPTLGQLQTAIAAAQESN